MNFYKKDKNIYNALQFSKYSKLFFLKYKISAPFSLEEAKTRIFNIHLG